MNFPSNILAIFNHHAGTQNPTDADIDVPSSILPVVTIPEQINELRATGDQTSIQRSSFIISNFVEATNQAAASTLIVSIGPGLWDIDILAFFAANFTTVVAGAHSEINISNNQGVGSTADLFFFYPLNTWITNVRRRLVLAIPGPVNIFHSINVHLQLTGVGQTINCALSIVGNRLG